MQASKQDSAPTPRADTKPGKQARRFTMPAVVLGLLGGHMVFILIAITLATGDRSFAVVPDYYNKAVDYDQRKAELAASEGLGWQVEFQPGVDVDAKGDRELVVVVRDRDGRAVTDAEVRVSCYHYARASEPVLMELTEWLPGQYAGAGRLSREGFWQFEVIATRGDQRFVSDTKQFVRKPEGAR
ncbi:MAG: FixH family protein [Phycisphaeraceae bacterium]